MSIFVKTINNLLSGNLDKIGKNICFDKIELNLNNFNLIKETNQYYEFDRFNIDASPIGIIYNLKIIENDDLRNYFYSKLRLSLSNNQIQDLSNIEENIYFLLFERSTSKLVNVNEYILNSFFQETSEYENIDEIVETTDSSLSRYLTILTEICMDDKIAFRVIPSIFKLKKELINTNMC
jgi:hypothetical protein